MVVKAPCDNLDIKDVAPTFSLNVMTNKDQCLESLDNLFKPDWNFTQTYTPATAPLKTCKGKEIPDIDSITDTEEIKFLQSNSINISLGTVHRTQLYLSALKLSVDTISEDERANKGCYPHEDTGPFVIDKDVISPLFKKDTQTPIGADAAEFLAIFHKQLTPLFGPFYSYFPDFTPNNFITAEDNIKTQDYRGSVFYFDVHLKKGGYFFTLGNFGDPMDAVTKHLFSLKQPRILSDKTGGIYTSKSYEECDKKIDCAIKVRVP